MSCPKYKNYSKSCFKEVREDENIDTFDYCESERYIECPVYRKIIEKEQQCEFMEKCIANGKFNNVDIEKIQQLGENYCFSKKHGNCARYKLLIEGKKVPDDLLADGSMATIEV